MIKLIKENNNDEENYIYLLQSIAIRLHKINVSYLEVYKYIKYYYTLFLENKNDLMKLDQYFLLKKYSDSIYCFIKYNILFETALENEFKLEIILKNKFLSIFPNTYHYMNTLNKWTNYEIYETIIDPLNGLDQTKKILEISNTEYSGYLCIPTSKVYIKLHHNCLSITLFHYKNIYFSNEKQKIKIIPAENSLQEKQEII